MERPPQTKLFSKHFQNSRTRRVDRSCLLCGSLVPFVDNGEWWMAVKHSGQVSAFVDESRKFKDHKVIAIGCVAGYNEQVGEFAQEWGR